MSSSQAAFDLGAGGHAVLRHLVRTAQHAVDAAVDVERRQPHALALEAVVAARRFAGRCAMLADLGGVVAAKSPDHTLARDDRLLLRRSKEHALHVLAELRRHASANAFLLLDPVTRHLGLVEAVLQLNHPLDAVTRSLLQQGEVELDRFAAAWRARSR